MGLRINTNVFALNAQRNLTRATSEASRGFGRMASGLRIATAADDAAGLGLSERMRARVRSFSSVQRNVESAISVAEIVEGALGNIGESLVRLRELAVQSSNGTLSLNDRISLQTEYAEQLGEIDRIASQTTYAGLGLLNGGVANFVIQIGVDAGEVVVLDMKNAQTSALALHTTRIDSLANAQVALGRLDSAIDLIASNRGELGADVNRMTSALGAIQAQRESLAAAESRIRDLDLAQATAEGARTSILSSAATAVLAQANAQPELALRLLV